MRYLSNIQNYLWQIATSRRLIWILKFYQRKIILLLFYEIRAKWRRPRNHLLILLLLFLLSSKRLVLKKYRRAVGVAKHQHENLLFCFYRSEMRSDDVFPCLRFTLVLVCLTHGVVGKTRLHSWINNLFLESFQRAFEDDSLFNSEYDVFDSLHVSLRMNT